VKQVRQKRNYRGWSTPQNPLVNNGKSREFPVPDSSHILVRLTSFSEASKVCFLNQFREQFIHFPTANFPLGSALMAPHNLIVILILFVKNVHGASLKRYELI
jgi:hypothetical protein